jgi:hypothetical protein
MNNPETVLSNFDRGRTSLTDLVNRFEVEQDCNIQRKMR